MPRLIVAIAIPLLSTLLLTILPVAQASTGPGMTMSANEVLYVLGERVQIDGRVDFPLNLNNLMVISVFAPSGELFQIQEFEMNNDGAFTWSFTLPADEEGQWAVNARFGEREAQVVLDVLEADIFDKVYIESSDLLDLQGNNITANGATAGENIAIGTTIVNDEEVAQAFTLMIQILDGEGIARSMLFTFGSLQPEESISRSISWLPDEQGSYTAEILVWTSLNDPAPLVEKHTFAFAISSP